MRPHSSLSRLVILLGVCLLLLSGCKQRERKIRLQQTDEDAATLASVIHMADPRIAPQLLTGFYTVESNAWRWTMGKFAVALRPPRNAAVYTQAGENEYLRDVDAKLLAGEAVNVEFTLDNFVPAGVIEQRELGVIATSVGFEAK